MATTTLRIRVDSPLLKEADELFARAGLYGRCSRRVRSASAVSLCWTAYSKSASSRFISPIALSRLHLPPDLYKCGGKPFAFIGNALRRKPAILFRFFYRLHFARS